jgi:hypothetical protein
VWFALAACGGGRPAPAEPKPDRDDDEGEQERGSIPDDVEGPPKTAWKDLDRAHREKFMAAVVVPTMKPLFVAHDATKFQDFGCAACHGGGAKGHTFAMPNPELFALPADLATAKPEWVKFMTSEVEPEMAKLLGLPEGSGFSCKNCHTQR